MLKKRIFIFENLYYLYYRGWENKYKIEYYKLIYIFGVFNEYNIILNYFFIF